MISLVEHKSAHISRVVDRFVDHMRCKFSTPDRWWDPVAWMPHEHNKVADGLADLTMDRQQPWEKIFPTTLNARQAHVLIQTDGGLRTENCAAASRIIGLWGSDQQKYEPCMAGGTFIETS